ncbi:MAG: fibronectin type III domain-containing protein [Acidobacteria bacterium]|nr:fibronectin type III domain-containing protein [Acidobacteriota bacterium]
MPHRSIRLASLMTASLGLIAVTACSGTRSNPVGPSSRPENGAGVFSAVGGAAAPVSVSWSCLTSPGCGAGASATARAAAALTAPNAPSNLAASVSGTTVTLSWTAPATGDAASAYVVEAGSTPGTSNLANSNTGHTTPSLVATDVPVGTYYVRVRAQNTAGVSAASNEIVVTVGGTPCTPAAPSGLTSTVSGSSVTFTWTAPGGTCRPTTYELDAGSSSGASNLATVATGSTLTSFSANNVANGTYYVRVRAANGANLSPASNEVVVTVGSTTSASLTGRWLGLSPDGLIIDASTGSCDIEEDIQLDLTQTGSALTGTLTERIRKVNPARPTCDTVGAVYGPWVVAGTAGAGTVTLTVTVEKGQTSTYTGTFTATRMVLTPGTLLTGAVMTLNRQ